MRRNFDLLQVGLAFGAALLFGVTNWVVYFAVNAFRAFVRAHRRSRRARRRRWRWRLSRDSQTSKGEAEKEKSLIGLRHAIGDVFVSFI